MSRYERSLLGAILIDGRIYEQAADLRIDDFSIDSHRRIFLRMGDLVAAGRPIDILTVVEELDRHKELQSVGDAGYVAGLMEGVPERPSLEHYVRMIREAVDRRRAAKFGENVQRLAEDPSVSMTALAGMGNDLLNFASGAEPFAPRFSEEALALRFSRRYAENFRYVASRGCWMRWNELRWVQDDTLEVFDLVRAICRDASVECGDAKERSAMKIAAAQTVRAIESLAQVDRRLAATVDQWDTDSWLLNTPEGTVDLRTGEIHEHCRQHYITKMTKAGPGPDCPLWLQFLDRITGGDSELCSFLQRLIGYSLTGSTQEHALFFLYGTGANGKSVFLSAISNLLHDYAKAATASAFTATTTEQHPTDMAGLMGARFVTAIETEDSTRWAESKIKSLTGGDAIAARFMRCDFFNFTPQFKLVIAGNHKPGLRAVDEAIRRRFHLIPFTVTIPLEDRDSRLTEKLKAEFPGILGWAIQGCLDWQQHGLKPPAVVREATEEYLRGEDKIGRWIEERCIKDETCWSPTGELFADYAAWCKQAGERESSQKSFTQQLESRGHQRSRTGKARGFVGIALQRDFVTHVTGRPVIRVAGAGGRPI